MKKSGRKEISNIKLAVFPGNPGNKYALTRHNISWILLDELSRYKNPLWQKKFKGTYSKEIIPDSCICLKPETFMNKTGNQ